MIMDDLRGLKLRSTHYLLMDIVDETTRVLIDHLTDLITFVTNLANGGLWPNLDESGVLNALDICEACLLWDSNINVLELFHPKTFLFSNLVTLCHSQLNIIAEKLYSSIVIEKPADLCAMLVSLRNCHYVKYSIKVTELDARLGEIIVDVNFFYSKLLESMIIIFFEVILFDSDF
jgi:hypothetical protein